MRIFNVFRDGAPVISEDSPVLICNLKEESSVFSSVASIDLVLGTVQEILTNNCWLVCLNNGERILKDFSDYPFWFYTKSNAHQEKAEGSDLSDCTECPNRKVPQSLEEQLENLRKDFLRLSEEIEDLRALSFSMVEKKWKQSPPPKNPIPTWDPMKDLDPPFVWTCVQSPKPEDKLSRFARSGYLRLFGL